MNYQKYRKYPKVELSKRKWPENEIEKAPIWCSVDLRDGNQALPDPMNSDEKIKLFNLLLKMGFKEIEVGFPSASQTDYEFLRKIIDKNLIPDDVTIQVLTQAREELIEKTFKAIQGAKKVIVHLYNSTSALQRKVVFKMTKEEIKQIAVNGTKLIKELGKKNPGIEIKLQYSPESFTGTEMDFALEICEAVMEEWQPSKENKIILNLPATVEMSMPNIHADQIEWFLNHINKEKTIISLHTHNDRGTGVAASELALLAGAGRVEGTLFGNGERTGNVDIITLGLNLYSQGIDPQLDFSNINEIVHIYEQCCKLQVHPRHPYAGELVYTAFSGSHQDAIKKGFDYSKDKKNEVWEVPYLPIDPADLGREYEAIIRINSQSGKGGVAYILENEFGFKMPKVMHPEMGSLVQKVSDEKKIEITAGEIYKIFKINYLDVNMPYKLVRYKVDDKEQCLNGEEKGDVVLNAVIRINDSEEEIQAKGNGPIEAFVNALKQKNLMNFKFISYDEHALSQGEKSKAVAYIQIENEQGKKVYGVGVSQNINTASLKALLCAMNRSV